MTKSIVGNCDRCGLKGDGRYSWMYFNINYRWVLGAIIFFMADQKVASLIIREFHCNKCRPAMKRYSLIAAILALVMFALFVWVLWVLGSDP